QNLYDLDLIEEIGTTGTGVGRKPCLLKLKTNSGYSISFDIQRKAIKFLVCDLCGQKLYLETKEYSHLNNVNVLEEMQLLIDSFLKENLVATYGIIGITIAIDGVVKNNNIIFTPEYDLSKYHIVKILGEKYNTSVFIHSHNHFCALGENTYSLRAQSLAVISVYNSINMGLIANNQLFFGRNGQACQLGHMIVEQNGRECACGEKGCLCQYTSMEVLVQEYSILKNEPKTLKEFLLDFKKNDAQAEIIGKKFIKYMSIAIKNVVRLYDPEIIVIDSPFTNKSPEIFIRLKNSLGSNKGILYKSVLADTGALYGGAVNNITSFFKIQLFAPSICYFH
ncbi:MAG: ROK family protein, partial [Anaerotignaceae bacterium]